MADDESLAQIGEFAVIERLVAGREQPAAVAVGPGDDAALVRTDGMIAVSTDMLVQDRHFRLDWSTPYQVGRKAIAQNAADIEAMGGRASACVVAFGAPADTAASAVAELTDGMWDEAKKFGAGIVGGDLVQAPQWVISVTVWGDLGDRPAIRRSGARAGDVVAVAGELGRSAAGYALWSKGIERFPELRSRHLVPTPPYGQGAAAAAAGATAMTDVSDGLLADLGHVATASGVVIDVSRAGLEEDRRSLASAAEALDDDVWGWILGGGEDHALVATFPGDVPAQWRVIGQVRGGAAAVRVDGAEWSGTPGWQSFG